MKNGSFIGIMWYEGSKKVSLGSRIIDAANALEKKYGITPTRAYVPIDSEVSKEDIELALEILDMLEVEPSESVLPNHVFVGRKERA